MKLHKFTTYILILLATCACREPLPEDLSSNFARYVVRDICQSQLQPTISEVSTLHKASCWLYMNPSERLKFEDLYFSKIAPRAKDNTLTVISNKDEIEITHNNIPIDQAGAEWKIVDNSLGSLSITNPDGDKWLCTQSNPRGKVSMEFTVEWREIDKYECTIKGRSGYIYTNSPIVAQEFSSLGYLVVESCQMPPYAINTQLSITEGELDIQLLNSAEQSKSKDDIVANFNGCAGMFNPLISFRGRSFDYEDMFFFYE